MHIPGLEIRCGFFVVVVVVFLYYSFHKGAAPDWSLISEIAIVSLPHADIFTRG